MTRLSVVVPIFNVEPYLQECLTSILSQDIEDLEVICVNDGSTDKSLRILLEEREKDNRIHIIDKPNSGYGHSMNVGMNSCSGEYLAIVEPDDFILPGMFKTLLTQAVQHKLDIVKSDFYRFVSSPEMGYKRYYNQLSRFSNLYNRVMCPENEQNLFFCIMNTWSGIYNLNFLRQNKIVHNETPGASFQDNGFWFNGFSCAERVMFIDRAFYMNRRDNPNSSVKDRKKMYCMNEEYAFIKKYLSSHGKLEKFYDVFLQKKWTNYFFTIRRLDPRLRPIYVKEISKELSDDFESIFSKKSFFSDKDKKKLRLMKLSPSLYAFLYNIKNYR